MFHVLLALAGDDLHGYAILKEVELRTGGKVRLSTGTLYGIIKRLLNDGLIVELRSRPADSDDERRRYYRLTPQGRQVAAAEAERMDEVLSIARSRNLLKKAHGLTGFTGTGRAGFGNDEWPEERCCGGAAGGHHGSGRPAQAQNRSARVYPLIALRAE